MPEEEAKAIKLSFENGKMIVEVDPNKDGDILLRVELALSEIPDEIVDAIKNR